MTERPKTALIAVDVQFDFIGGVLGGTGRLDVVEPLMLIADIDADVMIATRDWHPPDHCSFSERPEHRDRSWPVHCVAGTVGAQLAGEIQGRADVILNKGMERERESYSAFDGEVQFGQLGMKLDKLLGDLGVERVIVGGLVLEYCVAATALDAKGLGYETLVAPEAVAAIYGGNRRATFDRLRSAGVALHERT